MSLLSEIYATPNRVQAVVRLLLAAPKHAIKRERMEHLISPDSLAAVGLEPKSGWRGMVKGVLKECKNLGLIRESDGVVSLAPDVREVVEERGDLHVALVSCIEARLYAPDDQSNRDLAIAIAWYLGQPVLSAPGTWSDFQRALDNAAVRDRVKLNDNTYQMLTYWAPYLGFARNLSGPDGKERIAPDPTSALKRLLPAFRSKGRSEYAIRDFLVKVGKLCPLLDGGKVRQEVVDILPEVKHDWLSDTTSHAFMMLEEMDLIVIEARSDAPLMVLADGATGRQVSEVVVLESADTV